MDLIPSKNKKTKLRESIIKIRNKYPDKIPIFVLKSKTDKILPEINVNKFVVPAEITIGELMNVVRKKISLKPETSMFFFVNENVMPCVSDRIGELYEKYKNEDDLLLIYYCGENTFG